MRKIFLSTLIYTLVIGALFGIFVVLSGAWNELTIKVLLITGTVFAFSIPGLCCSSLYEKKEYNTFSSLGMAVCFGTCLYIIFNIITELDLLFNNEFNYRLCLVLILLSWSAGHVSCLLAIKPNDKTVLNVRDLTILLSGLIDALWILRIMVSNDDWLRLDAVLAILISLGTIVVPIANKITKKETQEVKAEANVAPVENPVVTQEPVEVLQSAITEVKEVVETPRVVEPENNVLGSINTTEVKEDKYDKLEKIKKLLDSGAITQEEYDSEKKKILEEE